MRLLLTRAAADAARTREKLEAMGHEIIVSPVIETVGLGAHWPAGVVDAVLATSGAAFHVQIAGGTPEARRLVPLYLVGARTEGVARANGFLGPAVVAKNAASLAIMLGKLAGRPRRMVYLAARDRKPDIETALDVTGQALDVIEVYEARAVTTPTPDFLRAVRLGGLDGVLHFSRRSAALFVAMAAAHGLAITEIAHYCLSDDTAVPLREAGCGTVHVAETPSESDLLALLALTHPLLPPAGEGGLRVSGGRMRDVGRRA